MSDAELCKRLVDWSEHDEGKINDTRQEAKLRIEALTAERDEIKTTWGFWVGILSGMLIGTFVFGVALIGQGVWEAGRMWGEAICEIEGENP
jgi:hypothetical protein